MALFCHTIKMSLFYRILIVCTLLVVATPETNAQKRTKSSSEEDIAIAFYKTGGIQPNFKQWVEKSELYQDTPAARRDEVMDRELQRLASRYHSFNPKKNLLIIQTYAKIKAEEVIDPVKKTKSYSAEITFAKEPDAFFFPYVFQENNFAVMPLDLQKMMKTNLSEMEYQSIDDLSAKNKSYPFVLALRPTEAKTDEPIEISDVHQWILKTEIITADIWKENGALIWEYTSPGYIAPETKVLNELFELKDENAGRYGTIKPLQYE